MGQCASNKAKGNLSVKKILSHKKNKKMEKQKHLKESRNETNKSKPVASEGQENGKVMDLNKKTTQKYTKGVAMSFGFKKRPTPMTSHTSVAWEAETPKPDANGNREETSTYQMPRHNSTLERNMHKMVSSQKPAVSSITPAKPPRLYNFPQSKPERSTSVREIKSTQTPIKFSTPPPSQGRPGTTQESPSTDFEHAQTRTCSRTITIVTQSHVTEKDEFIRDPEDTQDNQPLQTGKFTFQTTRLPQPESVKVIETKTAKTIANNNRKSARLFRQYDRENCKSHHQDDSGFESNSSGVQAHTGSGAFNIALVNNKSEERLKNTIRFSRLESSDSYSEACTPPPLPELPSAFGFENPHDTNRECENVGYNARNAFLKSNKSYNFLKSRNTNLLDRGSPNSSDPEWLNGGEAMAEDITFSPSPKFKVPDLQPAVELKPGAVAVIPTLNPALSLEMIDSLKNSMHLSVSYDGNFGDTDDTNKYTATLLDDEILSPVESLLSSSETEDIPKKRPTSSSTHSKDINEKPTPSPLGSPTRTYSLSLSDDKEDFLIDDEIADQPELVFEDGHHMERAALPQTIEQELLSVGIPRRTSYNSEFSPLPVRRKRNFLQGTDQGSFDSLSPCDSIGSEDLMMDFDVSQSNEVDVWERQSTSVTSTDGTSKNKPRSDENVFNNKNCLKSLASKNSIIGNGTPTNQTHSPSSVRRFSCRSSPDCRSPKRHPIHFSGYHSMTYDPATESVTLTRTNHSAIQQDIIGIKTMLGTLKRVLNDSESHSLRNCTDDFPNPDQITNNNNNTEFSIEMADLKRQILFLQGQLEDKEKTVSTLQKQVIDLETYSNHNSLDNATVLPADTQNGYCNAATQTERTRPLSTGVFSVTSSPMEDNNPILRLIVK